MKPIITLVLLVCFCGWQNIFAQQTNTHKVIKDEPGFGALCNLYISPVFHTDFPMYGPRLVEPLHFEGSAIIGYGIRAYAILKERFMVDFNFRRGVWPAKTYGIEGGGTLLFRQRIKRVPIIVNVTRRESGNYVYTENLHTTGNQMDFAGLRGGLMNYRATFEDDNFFGSSNHIGINAGIAFGFTQNLQVRLLDNRVRETATYVRYYIDFMMAGGIYTPLNPLEPGIRGMPFGFRIGVDTNNPLAGVFTRVTNIELGYRPGLSGYYISMAFSPVSIRSKIKAFDL
jgi:hypothetical protein